MTDRAAGTAGLTLSDIPRPRAVENDVIVRVHAAGFTPGEPDWPGTWTDRAGRDRTPSVPGHELSGVATGLGYRTTADAFVDLLADRLEDVGEVDVVFDVIGGEVAEHSAPLGRADARSPHRRRHSPPTAGRFSFVVEPDRSRLADLAERARSGRLKPIIRVISG